MRSYIRKLIIISILIQINTLQFGNYALANEREELKVESRNMSNFHCIFSSGYFKLNIKMGDTEEVKLTGSPDDLKLVETYVKDEVLILKLKNVYGMLPPITGLINIEITARNLDGLLLSGAGDAHLEGLESDSFEIQQSGIGEISGNINNYYTSIFSTGSGKVNIQGKSEYVSIDLTGDGHVNAKNLESNSSEILLSGSGSADVFANDHINATIAGSGSVKYAGDPNVSLNKIGSGSISKFQ